MRARSSLIFLFGVLALVAHCQEEEDSIDEEPVPDEEISAGEEDYIDADKLKAVHAAIDVNKDGKVSKVEMHEFTKRIRLASSKNISSTIEELDSDKDGKVSEAEYMKDIESTQDENVDELSEEDKAEQKKYVDFEKLKFKAADRNKDGFLNADELPSMMHPELYDEVLTLVAEHEMKQRDHDKDGQLTPKEFWFLVDQDASEIDASMNDEFDALDKDKNGKISLKEFKEYESGAHDTEMALQKILDVADADKDHHVTADELAHPDLNNHDRVKSHFWEWAEGLTGHGGEL